MTGTPSADPTSAPAPTQLSIRPAGYHLTAPVERSVAVMAAGTVYIVGGLNATGTSVGGVFSMDPVDGSLISLGAMPSAFHDGAGAWLHGRLVVFGGGSSTSTDLVQAFDPRTGRASVIGHLPTPLSDLTSATMDGVTYLVGGYDGTRPRPEIYATTDGVRFRIAATLPQGLRYPAVAAVGGALIVAGGLAPSGLTSQVESVDPTSGAVRKIGRLATPTAHAAAVVLGDTAYVVGGQDAAGDATTNVVAIDPSAGTVTPVGSLSQPLSDTGVAQGASSALLIGGWRGGAVDQVLRAELRPGDAQTAAPTNVPTASPQATSSSATVRPFAGLLLIADRGNDRLLVVNAQKKIVWSYPAPGLPAPPFPFSFPDDAFWVHGGHAIIVNQEENNLLTEIAYPSGKTLWTYGHAGVAGSSPGYLHQPDDLYPYPGGGMVVADAKNCRILFFTPRGTLDHQLGATGVCSHGLPGTVGYPNGDTPLPNGHLLLSELNGAWIDEVTANGHVVWARQIPAVVEPSDPQRLPDGSTLVASYALPGGVVRFDANGRVLWIYHPSSGPGMLDHPSLAAPLPNGLIAVNDDYHHRIVLIDPVTRAIVWQYGTGVSGSGPGELSYPDGLDLLLPGHVVPLHVDFPSRRVQVGRP